MTPWSDKPLEDREYPDSEDLDDQDDEVLGAIAPCPHCGRGIYEDAQQCPVCHEWLVRRDTWRSSRKWYVRGGLWASKTLLLNWIVWIGLSALTAILLWIGLR